MTETASTITDNLEQYFPLVWSIARSFSRENSEDSDAFAEGLIHLLNASRTYDPERGNFATWARTLIVNGLRQWGKRRCSRPLETCEDDPVEPERGSYPVESVTLLYAAASGFDGKDGRILRSRLNGETWKEIGDSLGCSKQAAEQLFNRRILPRLRESFGAHST